MKRLLLVLLGLALIMGTVAGCGNNANQGINSAKDRPRAEPPK